MTTVVIALGIFMSNLFLYCYFGELATESFEKMYHSLNDIIWYKLPIELQKYYILMAANMQIPLHYHGFGIAILNLQTMIKVWKFIDI